jgi:drug/metabolite transporter superfamily protein YnfA
VACTLRCGGFGRDCRLLRALGRGAERRFAALAGSQTDQSAAGRTFAAYGGIYIVASLGWLALAEGQRLNRYDLIGAALCLIGAGVIALAPKG